MSAAVCEAMLDNNVFHPTKEYPSIRGYFMSIEEKDAAVGRVLREQKAAKEEVALLEAEADRYRRLFRDLSEQLGVNPQSIGFHGEQMDVKFYRKEGMFDKADYPSQERLTILTSSLRLASERLELSNVQASRLGH
jgi:hypothetical protein